MMQLNSWEHIFFLLFVFCTQRELSEVSGQQAMTPPRGWNSYDSFSWTINEDQYLQSAQIISQRLLSYGYSVAVVDYLWYRKYMKNVHADSLGFDVIDEWGRPIPDPSRWPSSAGGKGFSEVSKKVHAMGLKFGIHIMGGISTQAVNANTPILDSTTGKAYFESGRQWYAKDIGLTNQTCPWMSHGFMRVDTRLGAARAFLKSLQRQYADWGVDFVKHDCVFGEDLDANEIIIVSESLKELRRPTMYSLSPGAKATPIMAKGLSPLVNMYRVTGDDWDNWVHLANHFDVARDFAASQLIGNLGLHGKSWPDLDMLPLGWLTDPAADDGPHRKSSFSLDEAQTQMTLWSMAKSPLMFGGDVRNLDNTTYNIITNPTLLEINSFSQNNQEFPHISGETDAKDGPTSSTENPRSQQEISSMDSRVLDLTNCNDLKAKGWVSEVVGNQQRICWKHNIGNKHKPSFCLYKRNPVFTRDKAMLYEQKYKGMHQLLSSDSAGLCTDASLIQKLNSPESTDKTFSTCKLDDSQMWMLNNNDTLVNSHSGKCAVVNNMKALDIPSGPRSWVATGRIGEIYLAYFNLSPQVTKITANMRDIGMVLLQGKNLASPTCTYTEVWTGKYYGVVPGGVISQSVAPHGCALFVIKCSA